MFGGSGPAFLGVCEKTEVLPKMATFIESIDLYWGRQPCK